jgi:hypothetical protein
MTTSRVRARLNGFKGDLEASSNSSLKRAALWNEVKDKLSIRAVLSAASSSGLASQRAIATDPRSSRWMSPARTRPRATLHRSSDAELKERYTIVIVTHNMQQAARASDTTSFMTMGEDRAGYVVEQGDTVASSPTRRTADRGLRVRPVRLSGPMTRRTTPGDTPWMHRSNRSSARRRRVAITLPTPREALDREEHLIRDAVLRMGPRRSRDPRGGPGARRARRQLALDVVKGDAIINEAQRGVSRLIAVTIATQQPVARDLRYLLTLDHVTYELERMGDHAASVAKAVDQARARAAAPPGHVPARDGRAGRRVWSTACCSRSSRRTRSRPARSPSRTTRSTGCTHATSTRSVELMRQDPANVERGTRIIIASHYLERIGDRATNIAEDVVYLVTGDVEDLNP